jgi:membrane protease subunit (stomatin/prohibitin family)
MVLWRLPKNIVAGDHIIVRADEKALFFRDGKIVGILEEGEHTLTTANVPFLGAIVEFTTGRRYVGDVYYIWMKEFADLKFGTSEPMVFKDADFGLVRLRAFGSFSYRVTDITAFVTQFVGTLNFATSEQISGWMKSQLVRALNDALGELKAKGLTVTDIPAQLDEMTVILLAKVKDDLLPYGVEVTRIGDLNINLPEEVQKAVDERAKMGALGLTGAEAQRAYMTMKAGELMGGAGAGLAKGGEGAGAAGVGVGVGAGMGAGMMIPGMIAQAMPPAQAQAPAAQPQKQCGKCGSPAPLNAKFCPVCGAPFAQKASCPDCKAEVEAGAKFCPSCGKKIQ